MCRDRHSIPTAEAGMVTETRAMAPVILGSSDASVTSEVWEEIYDLEGFPTGVEVLEIGVRCIGPKEARSESDDRYGGVVQNRFERNFVEGIFWNILSQSQTDEWIVKFDIFELYIR